MILSEVNHAYRWFDFNVSIAFWTTGAFAGDKLLRGKYPIIYFVWRKLEILLKCPIAISTLSYLRQQETKVVKNLNKTLSNHKRTNV